MLAIVAAIAGAGSYGLYRYAGSMDEQVPESDIQGRQ